MVYYIDGAFYNSEYIAHYGIKDQKWGVRRFQNEDGTLTTQGKNRYRKYSSRDTKYRSRISRLESRAARYNSIAAKNQYKAVYGGTFTNRSSAMKKSLKYNVKSAKLERRAERCRRRLEKDRLWMEAMHIQLNDPAFYKELNKVTKN